MTTSEAINTLAQFCGPRDVPRLTPGALRARIGLSQADVLVLFGGSILCGADVLAEAIRARVAGKYVIVGGQGHTTDTLRAKARPLLTGLDPARLSEAEIFDACLRRRFGLRADHLECRSTNCGNNITNLLALLDEARIPCRSIILIQDATMQRRMDAGLRKYRPDAAIVNYAAYQADVIEAGGALRYSEEPEGMWDMERYISLLLGEIPRLKPTGYGPDGAGFIARVEIPGEVEAAFDVLAGRYPALIRDADPKWRSA